MKNKGTTKAVREKFASDNLEAARIIASDQRYQGALAEWARMILDKEEWRLTPAA